MLRHISTSPTEAIASSGSRMVWSTASAWLTCSRQARSTFSAADGSLPSALLLNAAPASTRAMRSTSGRLDSGINVLPLSGSTADGRLGSQHLEQPSRPHSPADAHGDHHVLYAAPLAFDQRVAGEPRAGHSIGVPDRDRAAVDVEDFVRDAELILAIEHLDGERLVQLPQADVVNLQAEAIEQLGNRDRRADPH